MDSKSYELDPIPTSLLQNGLPFILPVLTKVIRISLQEECSQSLGSWPSSEPCLRRLDKRQLCSNSWMSCYGPWKNQQCWTVVAINLIAAFATIEHLTLTEVPHTKCGISGMLWFQSYLQSRRCKVNASNKYSSVSSFSVPQVSCTWLTLICHTIFCICQHQGRCCN